MTYLASELFRYYGGPNYLQKLSADDAYLCKGAVRHSSGSINTLRDSKYIYDV